MIGWIKYRGSSQWHRVEVVGRIPGTHHYTVRRSRTTFDVGPADVLVVVGG